MNTALHVLSRLRLKISRLWFRIVYAPSLGKCGSNTHVFSPFRMDGKENIHLGENTILQAGSWLYCSPIEGHSANLTIGSDCVLGYNNHVTSVSSVVIGNKVLTANNVYISDNIHSFENIHLPIIDQPVQFKRRVRIGFGSWIGENVSIIGADIGKNCVIGANSVVTRDIPDYSVAVGAPARVVKQYDHQLQTWINIRKSNE